MLLCRNTYVINPSDTQTMKTMYKINRSIDGRPAGTLYNFPYIKDARKRLAEIAAMCRGEITETTRNSFTAVQWGQVFQFSISK